MAAPRPIRPQPAEEPGATRAETVGDSTRLTPLRELQLLETHRAGGPRAAESLAELLGAYQRRIFAVCVRMTRNRDDAAELTQDSLIKVIEGLPSFSGQSKLSTWVIRVAMNCCLTHLRKRKIRLHESLDTPGNWSEQMIGGGVGAETSERSPSKSGFSDVPGGIGRAVHSREPGPGQRIQHEQTRDVIVKAMDDLDADMRAVLVLRDMQDLDYQQLAEVLEIPIGTVKSRLFRARAALRHAIETRGGI